MTSKIKPGSAFLLTPEKTIKRKRREREREEEKEGEKRRAGARLVRPV